MKQILIGAITALAVLTSCGSGSDKENNDFTGSAKVDTITVDQLFANPRAYINHLVTVEGVCPHVCFHGGRKAYLAGSDSLLLRCEALMAMGGSFPQECTDHRLYVTGIIRETRVDENVIQAMEQQHTIQVATINDEQGPEAAKVADDAPGDCDTERASRGQEKIETFKDRMTDYRSRIAQRKATEGKSFLSFYYLDADAYSVVDK